MHRFPSRLKPWPQSRGEAAWFSIFLLALAASVLTACSDAATLATKEYATQVARDNAAAAETNPASSVLHGLATMVASLAGAGLLVKRGIQRHDEKPFERSDGSRVTEAEAMDNIPKKPTV